MFALTPYRKEQPRTLSRQKDLPRLPIQPLAFVLDKYIKTLRPFLLDQADREGKDAKWVDQELDRRREWARDFDAQSGLGRILQERLKGQSWCGEGQVPTALMPLPFLPDIDRITPDNWLDDHFWIKVAYHSWRVSLVVNSNWWLLCKEDESIPSEVRTHGAPSGPSISSPPSLSPTFTLPRTPGEFTEWQIRRAAILTKRLVDFKLRLDRRVTDPPRQPAARPKADPRSLRKQARNPSRLVSRRSV